MITVTVTEIVDAVVRSGNIGGRAFGVTTEEGKLAHKRVEDGSAPSAMAEVPLEFEYERDGIEYLISGRADLIHAGSDGERDTIEELKTVSGTFFGGNGSIPENHIAQGVLYAFMWCEGTGAGSAAVRITYVPSKSGRTRSFECIFSRDELRAEAFAILAKYERWVKFELDRQNSLPASIKSLRFPYGEVREGQRDFMEAVIRTCRRKGRVMIQAPTGIGKTMAALYPSVKAIGAGFLNRIFYLTAKTSTRLSAQEASTALLAHTPLMRAITILARERVCPLSAQSKSGGDNLCSAEYCDRADHHYDRVGEALWELIGTLGACRHITPDDVTSCAERHHVCPYELSLDAAEHCDIIVCDYNYVFDPRVYLRRFFGDDSEHKDEKFALLCDEAHNLVDRAREMYSSAISLDEVRSTIDVSTDGETISALNAVAAAITASRGLIDEIDVDSTGGERGFHVGSEPFSDIASLAAAAADACGREAYHRRRSDSAGDRNASAALLRQRRLLSDFAASADVFDRRHAACVEMSSGNIKCSHLCLDASAHLNERMRRARAVVLFSATMEPPDYFARVLGCSGCDSLELPSPYDERNLCILIADKISTRMADRAATADEIASLIYTVASARVGNYICYLPSYSYLELISKAFGEHERDVDIVVQKRAMSERERTRFLSEFLPSPKRTKVGFCVLGGVFSEGVDLPGDRLSGVIIVGVGLPQPSSESNLLREYYDRICERGLEFSYVFPGMNKVLQAAGRVIRGEDDRGVVLLIDDRFGTPQYRALFPSHWKRMLLVGDDKSALTTLRRFWDGAK